MSDWAGSFTLAAGAAATLVTAVGGAVVKLGSVLLDQRRQRREIKDSEKKDAAADRATEIEGLKQVLREQERIREEIRKQRDQWETRYADCDAKHEDCERTSHRLEVELRVLQERIKRLEESSDDSPPRAKP